MKQLKNSRSLIARMKFLFLFFAVFLYSCGDDLKRQYLSDIDSLLEEATQLKSQAFDTIVLSNDKEIIESIKNTLNEIKVHYEDDTIAYELAKKLDLYKEIEVALSINTGNSAKAKQAIVETIESINNLKYDIEKGVNDRTSYPKFIAFEQEKLTQVNELLDYYYTTSKTYQDLYDSLHLDVEQFSQILKKD